MTLLAGLALRSSVLLAAGLLLTACLARRSAALRHRLLAATLLAGVLVLPVSLVVPEWKVTLPAPSAAQVPPDALAPDAHAPANTTDAAGEARDGIRDRANGASSTGLSRARTSMLPATARALLAAPLLVLAWLAGAFIVGSVFAVGVARVRRLAARASPVSDARWLEELDAVRRRYGLARPIRISHTDSPDLLGVWGIARPHLLLPRHARDWPLARLHVVLCHELAHVRRHDWAVQTAADVLRAILWFNPLAWLACARLRRESEQACDDEVIAAGIAGGDYASHLVELARQCHRPRARWAPAMPMAHPSTLERRIAAMLNPRIDRRAPSRRAMAVLAAVLVLVMLPVAALRARPTDPPGPPTDVQPALSAATPLAAAPVVPGGTTVAAPDPVAASPAPRAAALPDTLPLPAAIRAASPATAGDSGREAVLAPQDQRPFTGTIYDASGGVMPGVKLTLQDEQGEKRNALSNASGHFEFPGVAAGKYQLTAAVPGFRTLRQDVDLREAADWGRVYMLQVGELRETVVVQASRLPAPPVVPGTARAPVRVGGNIEAPRKEVDVKPVYPPEMREAGLSGVVTVDAIIGADGSVSSVRVVSGQVHPAFAVAAVDAVRQWRFSPTLLNGVAIEVVMAVDVRFALDDDR